MSDFQHKKYILPKYSHGRYIALMKLISNSLRFDLSDPAKFRHKVLLHYYKYGWQSTVDAFGVGRTSLYRWKSNYEKSQKKLNSLVPHSTRPKKLREMNIDWRLVEFLKEFRRTYGNIGKEKIKTFLDEYAKSLGISSLGCTTIGKIIKRKGFTEKPRNARRTLKRSCLRIKYAPKEWQPGYVELDSITLWVNGRRYYFLSIVDVVSRYASCKLIKSLTSQNVLDVYLEFVRGYSGKVRQVQTDNGHEFLGEFDEYLQIKDIPHLFTYPRSPKVNGVVERFNRTVQEEFVNRTDHILAHDIKRLEADLNKYIHWYNYKRPHRSLKLQTPYAFLEQLTNTQTQP